MKEELYTVEQAAAMTGKGVRNIRKLVLAHDLGRKLGRDWLLDEKDIEALRSVPGPGRPKTKKK